MFFGTIGLMTPLDPIETRILFGMGGGETTHRQATATGARALAWPGSHQGIAPDETEAANEDEAARVLRIWAGFLERTQQSTRYNGVRRLAARARVRTPTVTTVAVFADDDLRALIVADAEARGTWRGARRATPVLPALDCLTIPETGIVTDGSDAALFGVTRHLRALLAEGGVRRIELRNLVRDGPVHAAILRDLGRRFRILARDQVRYCRLLGELGDAGSLHQNSAKTRQGLRRKQRKLADQFDGRLEFERIDQPEMTDAFIAAAAGISAQTYQAAIDVGIRDTGGMRAFARELAEDRTFRGYLIRGGGRPIAYVAGDLECGTFQLWATSFLPDWGKYSPGIVLLNQVFDDLTAEGAHCFDFGHGEAAYKRLLSNTERTEVDLALYGPGAVAGAAHAIHRATTGLRDTARGIAAGSGRLDQLRRLWHEHLRRRG